MNLEKRNKCKSLTYPETSLSNNTLIQSKNYFSNNNSPKKIYYKKKIDYKLKQDYSGRNNILNNKKLIKNKKLQREKILNSINQEFIETKNEEFSIVSPEKTIRKKILDKILDDNADEIFTFGKKLQNLNENKKFNNIKRQHTVDNFNNTARNSSRFINKKNKEDLNKLKRNHSNIVKRNEIIKYKNNNKNHKNNNYKNNLNTLIISNVNKNNKYVFILNYKKNKTSNIVNLLIPNKKNCEISYIIDRLFDKYPNYFKDNNKNNVLIAKNNLMSFYKKGEFLPVSSLPYHVLLT